MFQLQLFKKKKEKLKALVNEAKIQSAQDALSNGLVDGLIYDDQLKKMIAKKLKGVKENDIPFVTRFSASKSVHSKNAPG